MPTLLAKGVQSAHDRGDCEREEYGSMFQRIVEFAMA